MRRSFKNDRSAVAAANGKVRNNSSAETTIVKAVVIAAQSTISRRSRFFINDSLAISDLNEDVSITNSSENAALRS